MCVDDQLTDDFYASLISLKNLLLSSHVYVKKYLVFLKKKKKNSFKSNCNYNKV